MGQEASHAPHSVVIQLEERKRNELHVLRDGQDLCAKSVSDDRETSKGDTHGARASASDTTS